MRGLALFISKLNGLLLSRVNTKNELNWFWARLFEWIY